MSSSPELRPSYVVPRYRADGDAVWYHVLHGNVPGYQIDFMYCPEVPHGAFTQNHFGHLARLMKYIEPREGAPCAFALGNLSRDDVQHEPGHGGIALIFGLRVHGVLDHAGRSMPPYAHAILAVDRDLDHAALRDAAVALHRRLAPGGHESHEDTSDQLYRRYARAVRTSPGTVERLLRRHVEGFAELPRPLPSRLEWSFFAEESARPRRITITHPDEEPFERLAHTIGRLGAMLYRSNIKWTTISSGRELDIPGGVSVRLVPESEAVPDPGGMVVPIGEIPEDEATMARTLFGAVPKVPVAVPARVGWRERYAAEKAAGATEEKRSGPRARQICATVPLDPSMFAESAESAASGREPRHRSTRARLWVGLVAAGAGLCTIVAVVATTPEPPPPAIASTGEPRPSSPAPKATPAPPPGDAGSRVTAGRLDITATPPEKPLRVNRRSLDRAASPPPPTAAPHATTSDDAPAAIGGKPRF
jgi:hypothetical protein